MLKAQSPNADSDLVWKYYQEGNITDMKLSPDNRFLVYGKEFDPKMYFLNIETGLLIDTIPIKNGKFPYSFDFHDSLLAVGAPFASPSNKISVDLYNSKNKNFLYSLTDDSLILTKYHHFRKVSFSNDGKYLLASAESYNYGSSLFLWDLETKKVINTFRYDIGYYGGIIDSQNKYIIADYKGHIAIIDFNTFKLIKEMPQIVTNFDFSPDGKYLATCGSEGDYGHIKIWDINSGFTLFKDLLYTRDYFLRHIKFTTDSKYIVSGGGGLLYCNMASGDREIAKRV